MIDMENFAGEQAVLAVRDYILGGLTPIETTINAIENEINSIVGNVALLLEPINNNLTVIESRLDAIEIALAMTANGLDPNAL